MKLTFTIPGKSERFHLYFDILRNDKSAPLGVIKRVLTFLEAMSTLLVNRERDWYLKDGFVILLETLLEVHISPLENSCSLSTRVQLILKKRVVICTQSINSNFSYD